MHLKQKTENDYYIFWLLHNNENGPDKVLGNVPGLDIKFIIEEPTPYAVEQHLGAPMELPVPRLDITDDYDRAYHDRRTTTHQFMQSGGEEHLYTTLPDEPMHRVGKRLTIDVHINAEHPNIVNTDWWYEDRPRVSFTALQWLTYLWRSSIKGRFFDPYEMGIQYEGSANPTDRYERAVPGLFTSIFCPGKADEIQDTNTMSYILFNGLWDCEDLNEDFRDSSGVQMLMDTRASAEWSELQSAS